MIKTIEIFPRRTDFEIGKSNVAETSIFSKEIIDHDGTADNQRNLILESLKVIPDQCIRELSERLGIQKSSVSPRINELSKSGIIIEYGTKTFKRKTVKTWRLI